MRGASRAARARCASVDDAIRERFWRQCDLVPRPRKCSDVASLCFAREGRQSRVTRECRNNGAVTSLPTCILFRSADNVSLHPLSRCEHELIPLRNSPHFVLPDNVCDTRTPLLRGDNSLHGDPPPSSSSDSGVRNTHQRLALAVLRKPGIPWETVFVV